jgi:hypothetical protein
LSQFLILHLQPPVTSRPFTEALPFYHELFETPMDDIEVREDSGSILTREDEDAPHPPSDVYDEAAAALRKNVVWRGVQEHVVIDVSIWRNFSPSSAHHHVW